MAQMTYSFSRLSLYVECPYRFYLRYIEKREEPVTEPLVLGKAVHKAIELILKGQEMDDAILSADMEAELLIDSKELRELVEKAPIRKGEGLGEGVEIEKYFNIPLSNSKNAPVLQGYIDLVRNIFGSYEFIDWKTNRAKYSPADTMQLPLYAWVISKIFKTNEVTGTLFFLRYFKNAQEQMTFYTEDMEKARVWAETTANEIEDKLSRLDNGEQSENLFPFQPNPHCFHCSFAGDCLLKYENKISGGIFK